MEVMRPTDNIFIRHATAIAIGAVTLLMLSATLIFWEQDKTNKEAKAWVRHTYEVRGHIRLLFGSLRDAETGQRGYLVTSNEEYLEPYEEALRELPDADLNDATTEQHRSIRQELEVIRKLTADNVAQQSNIAELEGVIKKLLDYLATTIEAKRTQNSKTEVALDFHRGKELMNQIRSLIRIMEAEENHLLSLRAETDALNTHQSNRMMLMLMVAFYLAMTLSIWFYQRSRARAAVQMLRYTEALERNEEELKMQQEELKASNEEIEAYNEEMEEKNKALEEQNAQIQQQAEELEENKRLIEEKVKEVERASKYKSEFLANMSHELRTPLNSLLILAKLLASNTEGNLTEEQIEEAHVIHNGGLELLGLINDILDLSKVEAGKLRFTAENVSLESMMKRVQQQFAPISKEKDVPLHITLAEDLPKELCTDAQRVEQVLKNLLSNAFKFTEHGSVTLEVRSPHQSEIQRSYEQAVAFSVIDTGIGIEASKLKDIFEAFQQENGSIDRHYGGTGLGLTIARKFAHMLGGEIHVKSQKGVGSTFTLVLPVKLIGGEVEDTFVEERVPSRIEMKPMPRTLVPEFIPDDRKNITDKDKVLLIVEDDSTFAATLMKIAHKRGYKCLVAGDGKTALVLAVEQKVSAVLLDLTLPDIDGMNVLEQLKHDLRTRHIPVHIISGRDEDNAIPMRKGAIGYLMKPVEKEAIDNAFTKIEHLLTAGIKQVLVVEDDKKTQLAITSLLKKKDIHITMAGTGSEALNHLNNKKFDCVILDLQLPDITGFDWLEKVEVSIEGDTPPIIIYTARELSEDENRKLNRYTGSIIIKGAKSPERLLDEVTLFLHSVESTLSLDQQEMIRMQHNRDKVLQGRTLLLVDDDLRNTFALSKLLKKHGMNIIIADNGLMALEKLKADPSIELIIMDIMMPVMDGYQAMHEIRQQKSFKTIPIIALTARAMPEEQEKCMAAGANDYLTKPVDIERLLTLLRVWLFKQEMAA